MDGALGLGKKTETKMFRTVNDKDESKFQEYLIRSIITSNCVGRPDDMLMKYCCSLT